MEENYSHQFPAGYFSVPGGFALRGRPETTHLGPAPRPDLVQSGTLRNDGAGKPLYHDNIILVTASLFGGKLSTAFFTSSFTIYYQLFVNSSWDVLLHHG